ncbi:MAG: mechanosensitive ion channel family protein, partial [Elusimicrobiota bacterium]|nr:mechanosensitive ion channel family protein [Elusimicrobiota bacterium]
FILFSPSYSQTAENTQPRISSNVAISESAGGASQKVDSKDAIPLNAVAPFGKVLFTIEGHIGSVSPEQRAVIVSNHIKEISTDADFKADSLIIVKDENSDNYDIYYKDKIVFAVDAKQADFEMMSKDETANQYRKIILKAVEGQSGKNLRKKWLIFAFRVFLALLIFILTRFVFRKINNLYLRLKHIVNQEQDKIPPIITKVLGVTRQQTIIENALKFTRIIILLIIAVVDIMALLWLFPQTRSIAAVITNYIALPLKSFAVSFWNYIPNLFVIAVIISIYYVASKTLKLAALKVDDKTIKFKNFHPDWAMPTYNIMRGALLIFTAICIFPYLPNSNSDIFKGMSVFIGLLLSLGSASIVNNIVSGFVITYMRPFQIGDRVKMGENTGDIIEKTSLVTRIKTIKNEVITIPNSNMMTAYTVNYTKSAKEHGLIIYKEVTASYSVPWRKVYAALIEAALKTPNVLQEPKPFVLQTDLSDYGAKYQLNVYIAEERLMQTTSSELFENIQDVFIRENIDMNIQHLVKGDVKVFN